MGDVTAINYFAAIPGRANRDDRLTGLHFRVLGTIAGHDRMGRNGQCCWAGRNTLADLVGCHPSRLSTAISDLIEWGYLYEQRHEQDGRKKGYKVVYEATADAAGIGSKVKENRLQDCNSSSGGKLQDSNQSRGNRLPNRNSISDQNRVNISSFQSVNPFTDKLNIFGRNQDITQKQRAGAGERGPRGAQQLTNALVEKLGGGDMAAGWQLYGDIPDEDRTYLERRLYRDELTTDDLGQARLRARQAAG